MKKLPMLVISAESPVIVEVDSESLGYCDKDNCAAIPVCSDGEHYVVIFPVESDHVGAASAKNGYYALPAARRIRISDGKAESVTGARLIDWGDVFELIAEPRYIPATLPAEAPTSIGSIRYAYMDSRAKIELYRENGLRLAIDTEDGRQLAGYSLGDGISGELSLLDVGRERLLSVAILNTSGERIVLLNSSMDALLDISGDKAGVIDGYPTAINELNTLRGLQSRRRYEYRQGAFAPLPVETGFFTRKPIQLETAEQLAVAFMQDIANRRFEEAHRCLSSELGGSLSISDIREFFGEFRYVRLAPVYGAVNHIQVGVFENFEGVVVPRRFLLEVHEMKIHDVEELN